MDYKIKKNIYATIVNNNNDIINAIVLSHSIKTNGSMYKIIVKISQSVDKMIIMNYFDIIVYDEAYFDNYDKILLIDVNSIVDKNLDYLFDIEDLSLNDINENIIYYEEPPYLYKNKYAIEERIKKKEYIIWFRYYRELINNNFDLLENKLLKEANDMLKYFISALSLEIPIIRDNDDKNNKYLNLNSMYGIKINKNHEYYYTNISKEYNDTSINFYTDNISLMEFINYVNILLIQKYNVKKYENIKSFINDCSDKEIIIELYLKYSPSILVILINDTEDIIKDDIEKNIIFKKTIELTNYELKNILFDINQEYVYDERIINLDNIYTKQKYKITLVCFETKDFINFKDKDNIIMCENIDKKIRASGLLLNKSVNIYDFIKNYKDIKKTLLLQSLKKWTYNNFNGEEITNMIIFIKDEKYVILDNNKYENMLVKIAELNKIKLYFMELIFVYSDFYKKIIKETPIYKHYDINKCFNIDGLRIYYL